MIKRYAACKRINSRGVTLVEMLIVMGLLSVFLIILTTLFTATLDSQTQTKTYASVITEGRYVMTKLRYDISHASSIATPSSLGGSDNSLMLTQNGQLQSYSIFSGTLIETDASGSAALTGDDVIVSNLQVQRLGNPGGKDTVRYSITFTSKAQAVNGGPQSQTFTSTTELR